MATCTVHETHTHVHGPDCGHAAVEHQGHVDYLHDGHAHTPHGDHYDECSVADVHAVAHPHDHAHGPDCGHDTITHGDHVDYLHDGHRHAAHGDHYDDHCPPHGRKGADADAGATMQMKGRRCGCRGANS